MALQTSPDPCSMKHFQVINGPGRISLGEAITIPNRETVFTLARSSKNGNDHLEAFHITGCELHECYPDDKSEFRISAYADKSVILNGGEEYNRAYVTIVYNIKTHKGSLHVDSII